MRVLQYAKERPQGRKLNATGKKNAETDQILIIEHADVRRMLLLQKAIVEGSMSLITEAAHLMDKMMTTEGEERQNNYLLLELLTPMVKTYPAEKGREAVDNGLQVLGGYGYCRDFILQQYLRDIRIIAIYEGTTGIQSQDLLGRKILMENGRALKSLANIVAQDIVAAITFDDLKPYAEQLGANLQLVEKVLGALMPHAMKGDFERYLCDATIFMDMFSTITVGWQWLKMATKAKQALVTENMEQPAEFYESKIHTMRFYYKYEMSKTRGLANTILDENELTIPKIKEVVFE